VPARPDAVAALPTAPGVYRFRDDAGRVLYVGRAGDLRRRVGSYWGDLRDRRHLRRMMPRVAAIEALVCDSAHEAAWAERNLLERSLPPWNRVAGGLEEIEAVEWVVAPQRVTARSGDDEDVVGWSRDVQVRLRLRGGRLRSWEQEGCPLPSPGTRAPAGWVPFLRRNADLAARLAALPVR
jgi:hypothetical protein